MAHSTVQWHGWPYWPLSQKVLPKKSDWIFDMHHCTEISDVHFQTWPANSSSFFLNQNDSLVTLVFKTELQWANRSDKSHIHSLLALKLAYLVFYINNLWEIGWKWKPVFVLNIVLLGNQPDINSGKVSILITREVNYGFFIFSSILGKLLRYRWSTRWR